MTAPNESSPGGEVIIYQSADGSVVIEVRVDSDTVWLTQEQLIELFQRDQSVISRHINNARREGELSPENFMQNMHKNRRGRPEILYDLDVVISVGYRVKSTEGIRFRRWATTVLRQHLMEGYSINQSRLDQLNQALEIISRSDLPEVAGVANVLQLYAEGLTLLDDYDHQRISKPKGRAGGWELTYDEAR
ncbi:MAG: virulence RhuM family protein, partial [Propionibacteriaceae bacterium]|nr:virulence RhuM family protein [Propionibacteriaceae bacterium]